MARNLESEAAGVSALDRTEDRGAEGLQSRLRALGRDALEGNRPLSDLLGEAFVELRSALALIRELEAELQRREPRAGVSHGLEEPGTWTEAVRAGGVSNGHAEGLRGVPALDRAEWPSANGDSARAPVDLVERPVPDGPAALEASLRARIAGALYLGSLRSGDRLPSIRELSRRTGLNHKVARRVYRRLEECGCVEVRDRSGIYLRVDDPLGTGELDPTASWTASVVADAVTRGLGAQELPRLHKRAVAARPLRCACVDATEDDRHALCHELRERFGLETVAVGMRNGEPTADLVGADLVVTMPFHAEEIRRGLSPSRPPVVAYLHPDWLRAVESRARGPLRLVCVDRAAGERLRQGLGPALARRVAVIATDELPPDARRRLPGSCLATRAACERREGRDHPAAGSVPAFLHPQSHLRIARVLVRLNTESPPPAGA